MDINEGLRLLFTEYGGLVVLLVLANIILIRFFQEQLRRNNALADRLVNVIESNTKAMSELVTHIKEL
jgi:hypothetical protein